MRVIGASDLARNTSSVLARIAAGETVSVIRNRTEIAHIIPARRMMNVAQAIAGLAGKLTAAEGELWLKESRDEFVDEVRDPWA